VKAPSVAWKATACAKAKGEEISPSPSLSLSSHLSLSSEFLFVCFHRSEASLPRGGTCEFSIYRLSSCFDFAVLDLALSLALAAARLCSTGVGNVDRSLARCWCFSSSCGGGCVRACVRATGLVSPLRSCRRVCSCVLLTFCC
jgi:hypothetical protein